MYILSKTLIPEIKFDSYDIHDLIQESIIIYNIAQ